MRRIWNQSLRGKQVNKELSTPIVSPKATWGASTRASSWPRTGGIILAGSALLAVCSHVSLPLWFTPVPLTVQPFAVLLLGLLLAPRLAAVTLAAYLAEGALGLPVFAPVSAAPNGLAHLLGPTGGYLIAYPLAAVLISFLWRRGGRNFSTAILSAALGDLIILACGAVWLAALTHTPARSALTLAVLPFLPGDALKTAAAAGIACGFQRLRHRGTKSRPTS